MSTRTTSARPASAIRWAVVAPTVPAPMTVTLFLAMGVSGPLGGRWDRVEGVHSTEGGPVPPSAGHSSRPTCGRAAMGPRGPGPHDQGMFETILLSIAITIGPAAI